MYNFSKIRYLFISLLALCLLAPLQLSGQSCTSAVCNAATMNQADVIASWPAPSNSNSIVTLNLPAGTGTWTSQVTLTVPAAVTSLIIQGASSVSCSGTAGTSGYACTPTDSSIIVDNIPAQFGVWQINGSSGTNPLIRFTGVTIKGGTGLQKFQGLLLFYSNNSGSQLRIDHSHFNSTTYTGSGAGAWAGRINNCFTGVIDHNVIDSASTTNTTSVVQGFFIANTCNDTSGYGDGSWATASGYGGLNFLFEESNVFNGGLVGDSDIGGKVVYRYNTINSSSQSSSWVHNHGTETNGGRVRGTRAMEIYKNYFHIASGTGSVLVGSNGGSAMIWGNIASTATALFSGLDNERNDGGHHETATPNGWGFCGTSTIDPNTGSANGVGSAWDGNSPATTGVPCLDGLGRGFTAQALNGQNFPSALNSVTGTIAWPQQYLEPIYEWMNTLAGTPQVTINSPAAILNRDVYVDNASFTGATGTGFGLLSARPSTCTAGPGGTYGASPTGSYGVAYWATDANSGNGELYVCDSTNHWAPVYQPAVFPNPLVSSVVANPTLSPTPGSYGSAQTITLATTTTGSTICYTSDGSTPTTNGAGTCVHGSLYSIPFSVAVTTTIKAIGTMSGDSDSSIVTGTYTINGSASAPTFSPVAGTYGGTQTVSISSSTSGAAICYTTDGSTPTADGAGTCTHGTTYAAAVSVSSSLTIKAIASKNGWNDSSVSSAAYVINGAASTPTFSPVAGAYGPTQNVTISSSTSGATICYTTSGSTPTSSSPGTCAAGSSQYVSPVAVSTSLTLKAIATKVGFTDSSVGSAAYTINGSVATPTFSPVAGTYGAAQTVTISTTTGSSVLCYTTDGSTPTANGGGTCTHGTTYSTPITVSTSQTVQAIGTKAGFSDSAVGSAAYTINGTLPTPTLAPAGGSYGSPQSVTISVTGGSSVLMINAIQETANGSDTIGSSVHRNTYTNCIATCASGSPAPTPYGTLWCTAAIKASSTIGSSHCPSFASNGVVSSTISGGGTSALDNGNGAGGSDSPTSLTATYAGASTGGCGAHGAVASGYVSGLTFPDPGANAKLTMGITTGSPGNSSILTVSKYNSNGDLGRYVAQRDCVNVNSITVGGQHYESDYNYNTSGGTYMGFGKDFDYPNKHFRAAPQSSPWIVEELCPVAGGSCITTYNWPLADYLVIESYEHWNAGCTYSSGSACAFYDAIGIQPYSGGSPAGSMVYYTVRNSSTHAQIGFIPINKTSWTHPQYAIQHQWDINQSSKTLTANVDYSTAVAYAQTTGTATICYTTDGSTPTGDGAGNCTHGTTYTGAITVSTTTTVKAIATQSGYLDSAVGSETYTINGAASTPTFSPVAGTYSSAQTVTISTATGGATICYTSDGSTPTADGNGTCINGTTYMGTVLVASSLTLKAIASESGFTDSSVGSAAYVITVPPSAVIIKGTITITGSPIIK